MKPSPLTAAIACALALVACLSMAIGPARPVSAETFTWDNQADGPWLGRDFWANRLQDWSVVDGRVELNEGAWDRPLRTVHVLTHRLGEAAEPFEVAVTLGHAEGGHGSGGFAGLLVGAGKGEMDPRSASIIQWNGHGAGIFAGLGPDGRPMIADFESELPEIATPQPPQRLRDLRLQLRGTPDGGNIHLELTVIDLATDRASEPVSATFPAARLVGNVALAAAPGESGARYAFDDLTLNGPKVTHHPDDAFGPVAATQYTLSHGVFKLTAQLLPIPNADTTTVRLDVAHLDHWHTVSQAEVVTPGYTASFRATRWPDTDEVKLRIVVGDSPHAYPLTVRPDPVHTSDELSVAMVNCLHQNSHSLGYYNWGGGTAPERDWVQGMWFPHADLTQRIAAHDPDVMFFAGDQIYEGGSPTRKDLEYYELDYLYKWYMFCRTFGDLMRDRPSVTIIDDHDIYQGNLWGASGRKAQAENKGGYLHPAWFVKMVERTQTSHLPDPVDPAPIQQGIGVYFTQMTYGGVGFAILEDRKFKDGSRHPETNAPHDPHDASLSLLGQRQLDFLREWAGDWEGQDLKAVLSQTVFAQANTHSGAKLGRMKADTDTNGFPVPGRNRAVDAIRRGFAVHLCGDQHLATLLKHGIDAHGDAMWSFCGPSAANFWPRAWVPGIEAYTFPDSPDAYTGDHVDGFGNRITMYAAANPGGEPSGLLPTDLYDRVPGYGIVRFHRDAMQITFECWPRHADPADDAQQYEGWPRTIDMADNYARTSAAYLPTIEVIGVDRPVIRVTNADTGELIYARRFQGPTIEPGVFAGGTYAIEIGEPGTPNWRSLDPIAVEEGDRGGDAIDVRFGSALLPTP